MNKDNRYECPYCETVFVKDSNTYTFTRHNFNISALSQHHLSQLDEEHKESVIEMKFYRCPHCENYSIELIGVGKKVSKIDYRILPFGNAKKFPNYIPKAIKEDYQEACLIKDLSPKSSATLSRRCLQGMIRDFWEIEENNLNAAINKLEDKIPAVQWKVIHAVRQIGNIGAHMEKDINKIINIDSGEADKLIQLIEFLIEEWYINRYEAEKLFLDITEINNSKQKKRRE